MLKPWVSKKDSKDSDEPPPPSPPNAAPNSHPILTKTNIEERDELNNKNSLPYPNTNIVMKSLNFIQLDLFNSAPVNNDSEPDKNVLILKLENPSNLLDNAISYLQKNIKGVL